MGTDGKSVTTFFIIRPSSTTETVGRLMNNELQRIRKEAVMD
jgi:hypothetical protein